MKKDIRTHSKKKKALALLEERRLADARALYADVCKIDPRDAEAWFRLGTINLEFSAMPQAEACFRRVIELQPRLVIAYYNLGRALELQGLDEQAVATYRKLLQVGSHVEAYYNIGVIYTQQGRFEQALDVYREGLRAFPDNPRLSAAEAGVLEKRGDYDEAYARIQALLAVGRETPEIAIVLASLSRHMDCRAQAIELLERVLSRPELNGNRDALVPLHFELGRLLDAAGDYDRAFRHFYSGNEMSHSAFDAEAYAGFVESIMQIFTRDFMSHAPRARDAADHLIFIVGMPRSGTTLIEQILDSHPQVYGCGELRDLGTIANGLSDAQGVKRGYPMGVVLLNEEVCTQLAGRYIERVKALSGGADFVTDKMPQNFQFLGLIALLFPGAKIIHSLRDPLDTCLSCYFQNFRFQNTVLGFSTNMGNLASFYKQYQRLMAHWRATLDIEMLEVSYEDLVADQETLTRRMLEFCGLPWDEQCLRFYDTRRAVTTASYNQVRQPMYRKSVQRWKHYEQFLEPLKKGLQG